ncbi:hypothetical protein O181_086797 [Austropuccinia psidii MF-1]|uniref:Reverse transcriptase Ty1/copia-type domain-containing protein n=1 Tax=Austropuccinia psidii MF-1 TaxID=1389203 RepID=A0A9Q3INH1_9BASI|nr:hypothetical protein [Austropuccinia psidii MF-1]
MDAVAAFLNPKLEEEIYMNIPPFLPKYQEGKVWKLMKPLYGLKQASRYWYLDISNFLDSIKLKPSKLDPCLFISTDQNWECYVHIHVDDLTILSNNVDQFKKLIKARFEMEVLGPATYILGIEIWQDRTTKTLTLSQMTYVKNLLDDYQMMDCKPVLKPMIPNSRLQEASDQEKQAFKELKINYRQAIGRISYLQVATRGDLSFTTSQLSQFLENPGIKHWLAFKHLLRYLKGTISLALTLGRNSSSLQTFSDADYANCKDTRKLITGYMKMIGSSCINWKSKKQSTISTSSCEAEYKAQFEGGKDLIWIALLLQDLNINVSYSLQLNGYNQGSIALAKNPQVNEQTKHFDTIFHWIQEIIMKKKINIT